MVRSLSGKHDMSDNTTLATVRRTLQCSKECSGVVEHPTVSRAKLKHLLGVDRRFHSPQAFLRS